MKSLRIRQNQRWPSTLLGSEAFSKSMGMIDGRSRGNWQYNFLTRATKGQIFVRSLGKLFRNYRTEEGQPPPPPEIGGMWTQPTLVRAAGYGRPLGDSQIRYDKAVKCKFKKNINLQPSAFKGEERVDRGLPRGSAGKDSTCDAGDTGYSPTGAKSRSWLSDWACTSARGGGNWERPGHIQKGDKWE